MVFCSFYEITDPIIGTRKARMVCWFDGDTVHPRWELRGAGCFSGAMQDCVNEGYNITTGTVSGQFVHLEYGTTCCNSIRHFCDDSSILIGVIRGIATANQGSKVGFANDVNSANHISYAGSDTSLQACCFMLQTSSCTACQFSTVLCVALDTNFHVFKMDLQACQACGFIDSACAAATNSCGLPSAKLMPTFTNVTRNTGAKSSRINYIEAYNT